MGVRSNAKAWTDHNNSINGAIPIGRQSIRVINT
jgi:hypothetical protein